MTLLGVPQFSGGFSIGTNVVSDNGGGGGTASTPAPMDLSLDDMIQQRRKQEVKDSRATRGGPTGSDRRAGSTRAKRQAAVNARRGIAASSKPTTRQKKQAVAVEVEKSTQRRQRNVTAQNKNTVRGGNQAARLSTVNSGTTRRARVTQKKKVIERKVTAATSAKKNGGEKPTKKTSACRHDGLSGIRFCHAEGDANDNFVCTHAENRRRSRKRRNHHQAANQQQRTKE